jgi:hypothetical protein
MHSKEYGGRVRDAPAPAPPKQMAMQSATITQTASGLDLPARVQAIPARFWRRGALAALAVIALGAYLAFPTYPTYDSFYALLWGKALLAGHIPDLRVYRAPTEHPLAIIFGAFCSLFGGAAPRLMILGSFISFLALIAGIFRVARLAFGEVVAWIAGALMLSRFYDVNLMIQGYLDITYIALVMWAIAFELERPRRGRAVFLALLAAGLLRPDAWVLSGCYWLWWAWPLRRERARVLRYALLAIAPALIWIGFDWILTGDPLHSLRATTALAGELERSHGISAVLSSLYPFAVRIDKAPVVLGALVGALAAIYIVPRRAAVPLAALLLQILVFIAEGAVGASVINRYLLSACALAVVFCAFALGGWSLLARSLRRTLWLGAALALLAYGALNVLETFHISELPRTMAYHEDFHVDLAKALESAPVRAALARCPLVSLPDNKLIPDARFILSAGHARIVARSQASDEAAAGHGALARALQRGSVAIYPLGAAVFFEALVDPGDRALDQVPPEGFRRLYSSQFYAVYANC